MIFPLVPHIFQGSRINAATRMRTFVALRFYHVLVKMASKCVSRKEHAGITGMELVDEVLMEWEIEWQRLK